MFTAPQDPNLDPDFSSTSLFLIMEAQSASFEQVRHMPLNSDLLNDDGFYVTKWSEIFNPSEVVVLELKL